MFAKLNDSYLLNNIEQFTNSDSIGSLGPSIPQLYDSQGPLGTSNPILETIDPFWLSNPKYNFGTSNPFDTSSPSNQFNTSIPFDTSIPFSKSNPFDTSIPFDTAIPFDT
jgi:hypothetical protein